LWAQGDKNGRPLDQKEGEPENVRKTSKPRYKNMFSRAEFGRRKAARATTKKDYSAAMQNAPFTGLSNWKTDVPHEEKE